MSQFSYVTKPDWNNDGLRPNHVSSNVFPTELGWMAPMPGTGFTPVTNVSWSGGTTTFTASGHPFVDAQDVLVTTVSPSGYNGYYPLIHVVDANTFSVSGTVNSGSFTASGKAQQRGEIVAAIRGLDIVNADLIVPPTFTATTSPVSGSLSVAASGIISVTVTPSEPVYVDVSQGIPYVALTIGSNTRYAVFDPASSTSTSLVFKYQVVTGDIGGSTTVAASVSLNGGSINDIAASSATGTNAYLAVSSVTYVAPTTSVTISA